jgi:hypothetical protein
MFFLLSFINAGKVPELAVEHLGAVDVQMRHKLPAELESIPRQFSSDCGISIRFAWSDNEKIKKLLAEDKVHFGAIHPLDTKGM